MSRKNKVNKEIKCSTQQVLISRTDLKGNLIYYNPTFLEVNGFTGSSLINKPHSILRHPDMPKTIFRIIWSIIEQGLPIQALIKNKTNDGKYYWALMNWKAQKDKNNKVISYVAYGRQAPNAAVKSIEPLYKAMLDIEKENDIESALEYLHSYLEEEGLSYSQYMKKLTKHRELKCLCDFIKYSLSITK